MNFHWYYVENKKRVGPVPTEKIKELIQSKTLVQESLVWRTSFDNWKKISELDDFQYLFQSINSESIQFDLPPVIENIVPFNWNTLDFNDAIFALKIGMDRGRKDSEYGPYSLNTVVRLFKENRINSKTLIFTPKIKDWIFIADIPIYDRLFAQTPPVLTEVERRKAQRKPFVASMFFHDNKVVSEGICRDVSIGGMQVLVANPPLEIGEVISMNVHPGNDNHSFVAKGEVVRLLDGRAGFSLRFIDLSSETVEAIHKFIRTSNA